MYLKTKLIKFLEAKNVVFMIIGVLGIAIACINMISLYLTYADRPEVLLYAKSTPDSIVSFVVGVILVVCASLSRRFMGDASFYSSYFEGDLYGYIKYSELASVMGKSAGAVQFQLRIFLITYMKGYTLQTVDGVKRVELCSKKVLCECKGCGAAIDKREYFTGICPYCGRSDLFAKVIADNRFYTFAIESTEQMRDASFYRPKSYISKQMALLVSLCIGMCLMLILLLYSSSKIGNYFDQEYLFDYLMSGKGPSSYELIKRDIRDDILFGTILLGALIPVLAYIGVKLKWFSVAKRCSEFFSNCTSPFVDVKKVSISNERSIRSAIRRQYLHNCTLEDHGDGLTIALAKRIVKDHCPTCAGPIVGAVDEHYQCKFCGNMVMETIQLKS